MLLTNLITEIHQGTNRDIPEQAQNWLRGKLFIGPLTNQITINPTNPPDDNASDHVNNRCYYIRNRNAPDWWFVRPDKVEVKVSTRYRSKFCLQLCPRRVESLVLVGRDILQLTLMERGNTHRSVSLSSDNRHRLICPLGGNVIDPLKFFFCDFREGGFSVTTPSQEQDPFLQWTPGGALGNEGPGEDWMLVASEILPR
ncbi:hypothetical protein BDV32DRAFT_149833 [Aspergillus pseudonomiae]|nr:hypothetical protein BDV32DRAFT_149833 [Aspergillus pseudonomiae]